MTRKIKLPIVTDTDDVFQRETREALRNVTTALNDIDDSVAEPGVVADGDYGDVLVSGDGTVWTVESGTPSAHNHTIAEVTSLQSELDGKSDVGHGHTIADVTDLQTELDGKADLIHAHAIADTTGLQAALDAKSDVGHGHAISDTTGLQAELDAKVDGTGTAGTIPKWSDADTLTDSIISETGTTAVVNGNILTGQLHATGQGLFDGAEQDTYINWSGGSTQNTFLRAGYTAGTILVGDTNTGGVYVGAAGNPTTISGSLAVNGDQTLGDAATDNLIVNGTLSRFGLLDEGEGPNLGAIYFKNQSIGFKYNTAGSTTGRINYEGYLGGTTQFRNLQVYDGKQGSILTLTGLTKGASFAGALDVTGATTLTTLAVSSNGTVSGTLGVTGACTVGSLSCGGVAVINGSTTLGSSTANVHTVNGVQAIVSAESVAANNTTTGFNWSATAPGHGWYARLRGASAGISGSTFTQQLISSGGNAAEIYTDAHPLVLGTSNIERLRIDAAGACTVSGALAVTGATALNSGLTVAGVITSGSAVSVTPTIGTGTGRHDSVYVLATGGQAGDGPSLRLADSGGNYNVWVRSQYENNSPNFLNPRLTFGVQDANTVGTGSVTTRLAVTSLGAEVTGRLDVSGNVGLGDNVSDAHQLTGQVLVGAGGTWSSIFGYNGAANGNVYIRARENAGSIQIGDVNSGQVNIGHAGNTTAVLGPLGVTGQATVNDIDILGNASIGSGTTDKVGFYGTAPIVKQTAVPITTAGIHAALVALGLIS